MIKAAHGGGGKGMRIVREAGDFAASLESCQREASNAFGRDRVLLERYIEQPRHIEIQVFGDRHGGAIHLGERECSAQRRYQKVLEESPSPFLTPELRARMGAAAVQAAHAIDYANAGTVEFIVGQDGGFYFMEINTRLQVEHPVTEQVTGLDLVEWQLRIAAGEHLPLAQEDVTQTGHAIEVRLYAEDPDAGFLPGSGTLETLRLPVASPHVRIDSGVIEGDTVTIFYDPMIAKLIVWDEDRPRAMARLRDALAACEIAGPKSNIGFLERLIRHPVVTDARIDTGYLDRHLERIPLPDRTRCRPAAGRRRHAPAGAGGRGPRPRRRQRRSRHRHGASPMAGGWAMVARAGSHLRMAARLPKAVASNWWRTAMPATTGSSWMAPTHELKGARLQDGMLSLRLDGAMRRVHASADAARVLVHDGRQRLRLESVEVYRRQASTGDVCEYRIRAPMPGRVVVVQARPGDAVNAGDVVLVIEAMKMELALKAPRDGVVEEIRATVGEFVEADAVLATLAQ